MGRTLSLIACTIVLATTAVLTSSLGWAAEETAKEQVELKTLDFVGIQKLIASHKGKVVVLDCWSTSCAPCMEEFPKLVELHKKYGPDKIACISLSFDYDGIGKPADVEPDVIAFLKKQNATFDNVLCSEEADVLYKKLKLASIPAVYIFDREGKPAKRFTGEGIYADVPELVEKLVGE